MQRSIMLFVLALCAAAHSQATDDDAEQKILAALRSLIRLKSCIRSTAKVLRVGWNNSGHHGMAGSRPLRQQG